MGALTAVLAREVTGRGQHVDVSMHAACNVTTEMGTYGYLAGHETVLRQTGRHAMPTISMPTQMRCADGRYVTTGFPPRSQRDFESLLEWIETLGYRDEFPETMLLDLAIERGGVSIAEMSTDDLARDIFGAGREALNFIAERIPAHDFFIGGQTRGPRVRRGGVARGGVRDRAHQGPRVPGGGRARGARPHRPLSGGAVPHGARHHGGSRGGRRSSASTPTRSFTARSSGAAWARASPCSGRACATTCPTATSTSPPSCTTRARGVPGLRRVQAVRRRRRRARHAGDVRHRRARSCVARRRRAPGRATGRPRRVLLRVRHRRLRRAAPPPLDAVTAVPARSPAFGV